MTSKQNDIETVARAIAKGRSIRNWKDEAPADKSMYRREARAAYLAVLDCLEEPSAEMCDKGANMPAAGTDFPEAIAGWCWQAMLAVKRKEIEDA